MIYFVGAGAGAPDLITVRGAKLLSQADVIVYAGSLVNPALLEYKKDGCAVYDSAKMTLEEVIAVMAPAAQAGKTVVRLHTGDPCVYGAHREQMDALDRLGLDYEVCPGVSSFCGAAAALKAEYTLPNVSQTVDVYKRQVEKVGFYLFSKEVLISHAYIHMVEAGGMVEVCGMTVQPGDLIHADCHGAIVIPHEVAPRLAAACRQAVDAEEALLLPCRKALEEGRRVTADQVMEWRAEMTRRRAAIGK